MEVPSIAIVVLGAAVALLALPYMGKLLALVIPGAKGDFQKRTITELLTIRDRLEREGQSEAASLCRDSVIALVQGSPRREPQVTSKGLFS